ncbi:MAG: type II toxin-antitoxin system PemK/MazF family toxin [Bifidobacteriaceae bacterium]|nr:type II toxin-antitoxin system PemK/MazF family toxin [Bifidobacteriaceae bacterium]
MRGEVWTVRDDAYASKSRPAIVVQANDISSEFQSVVLVGMTTVPAPGVSVRVKVEPTERNGLKVTSYAMAEKPFTVKVERLGSRIGELAGSDLSSVSRALARALALTPEDLT